MIRLIKKSDYNKCCDIYNYYVINTSISFDLKPLSYIEYENKINRIIEKYPFLVDEVNGEILGFAYLDEFNSRGAYFTTADLTIYLNSNFIHNGIGSKLYLVLISAIFFLVLVCVANKQKVLTELSQKVYIYLHAASCICALLTLFLVIILLC